MHTSSTLRLLVQGKQEKKWFTCKTILYQVLIKQQQTQQPERVHDDSPKYRNISIVVLCVVLFQFPPQQPSLLPVSLFG